MSTTHYDHIEKALDLLRQGLKPFIDREMEAALGKSWLTTALQSLQGEPEQPAGEADPLSDAQTLLLIMGDNWNAVFGSTLGRAEGSLVSEIRQVSQRRAHQQPISSDDTYRALDSIHRLLLAVSAPEAQEVAQQKQDLLRVRFEEQARDETRKIATAPLLGRPSEGLHPWREIVTPHPDVASGRCQQAEFAADLAAVHRADPTTASEYSDPGEFFEHTFLTDSLGHLLRTALLRLTGRGGDPVVELQTNFGGGKTHSLLALYHLFSGTAAADLSGVDQLLTELNLARLPEVRRVVMVGTALSPAQPRSYPNGVLVRTLWGELAWQLGGRAAYALVAQADAEGVSPGSAVLRELFSQFGPCLVLIDEWLAYVRQLFHQSSLPAGSFEANMSFAQALTEAAKQAPQTLLVVSLPTSDIEMGGEAGRQALAHLKDTLGQPETPWRPASTEEDFEIVRRRLFQPLNDERKFAARDDVVAAFARMYREQPQEFPPGCGEADYEGRLASAYPIHPELFDRLYNDWSGLEKFQGTRGVLRLMAAVIQALWERNDGSLLIFPANIPISAGSVRFELTRYLEDNWLPVIEKDVDGPDSLPLALDRENPNLGRYSACRRVARTVYLGSAPTANAGNPGLDERVIKLGCVQPGESVATFDEALRHLTDQAGHLYLDHNRYRFSTQPSVTRLARDRAAQFEIEAVWQELRSRLAAEQHQPGDFNAVHAAPASSADVPDDMAARLVILGPQHPHLADADDSPARQEAVTILKQQGSAPRLFQNMLVFLAPDQAGLSELIEAVRHYLAWKSIHDERQMLNLDPLQSNQAASKQSQADETVANRIKETYVWLLVPEQSDPHDPRSLAWSESRLQIQAGLAAQASQKLKNDALLYAEFSAVLIQTELRKHNLWQGADHLSLTQLWENLARYPYHSRLRDQQVLLQAVRQGVGQLTWGDYFAYAGGWDEARQCYLGLITGEANGQILMDGQGLLVKPAAAQRQLEADEAARRSEAEAQEAGHGGEASTGGFARENPHEIPEAGGNGGEPVDQESPLIPASDPLPADKKGRRFYGTVELNAGRIGRDAWQIHEAIIQHLDTLPNATMTITLEIQANLPEGVSDYIIRTVTENAQTLKFKDFGFEEG